MRQHFDFDATVAGLDAGYFSPAICKGLKKLRGHRYARFRARDRVMAQCLPAAACQNMKKIARLLVRALLRLFGLRSLLEGLATVNGLRGSGVSACASRFDPSLSLIIA